MGIKEIIEIALLVVAIVVVYKTQKSLNRREKKIDEIINTISQLAKS
ncbi:MAG: hypothetical protein AB1397_01860 [bacterium]